MTGYHTRWVRSAAEADDPRMAAPSPPSHCFAVWLLPSTPTFASPWPRPRLGRIRDPRFLNATRTWGIHAAASQRTLSGIARKRGPNGRVCRPV
jgi:hypothetical protein